MEERPTALLLKFPGTNCDAETAHALETVGFQAKVLPTSQLEASSLEGVSLVVFSGGFSYGDYVMAGRLAQLNLEQRIGGLLKDFVAEGGYALGICNGFQILSKLGLLPEGSLIHNESERFMCRWAGLSVNNPDSPYLSHLPKDFELPVAHAEGRFVSAPGKAGEYRQQKLGALLYNEDINGAEAGIAGLQDQTGRVFGLMPHPERFLSREQHYDPDWKHTDASKQEWGWGYDFFRGLYENVLAEQPSAATV